MDMLKEKVLAANLSLPLHQLVTFTWEMLVVLIAKKVSWLLNLLGSNTAKWALQIWW